MRWVLLSLLVASLGMWGSPRAFGEAFDNQLPSELTGMGVTEHLSEAIPLSLEFRDERGRIVRLGDFFHAGRPVILSFNYSNCPMLCNLQLSGLVEALRDVELTCGKDFEFVSISIDPQELPQRAEQTRQRYFQMYGRQGSGAGWHFLVGSQGAITTLAQMTGVTYRYLPKKREYVHPAVCIAVTPDGRLSRYFYGVSFAPQTLRLGLVEASAGKIGTTIDQILLFCFHYDSTTGKYSLAARRLMAVAGSLTVLLIAVYVGWQFRREGQFSGRRARATIPSHVTRELTGRIVLRSDVDDGALVAMSSKP
jgi:protein SCO1